VKTTLQGDKNEDYLWTTGYLVLMERYPYQRPNWVCNGFWWRPKCSLGWDSFIPIWDTWIHHRCFHRKEEVSQKLKSLRIRFGAKIFYVRAVL
jgi:hypothetical protein